MEDKEISWGDCRLFIGDKEIATFASVDIAAPESDMTVISILAFNNNKLTITGTLTRTNKQTSRLNKLLKVKKYRLPRVLKKKYKKIISLNLKK